MVEGAAVASVDRERRRVVRRAVSENILILVLVDSGYWIKI